MIINHNMQSINAHRQMGINATNQSKSTEKLSSGLRINRAGDDAAGLAISEKMRGQIRGLDQAGRNAQDGISLIQTAEGALNETHSILQRMRELSVQSGNDTNTAEDRKNLQDEMNQLNEELDRIANTTEFNTKKLLDGSMGKAVTAAVANINSNDGLKTGGAALTSQTSTSLNELQDKDGNGLGITSTSKIEISFVKNGKTETVTLTGSASLASIASSMGASISIVSSAEASVASSGPAGSINLIASAAGETDAIHGITITVKDDSGKINQKATNSLSSFTETTAAADVRSDGTATLQIGANTNQNLSVEIGKMDAKSLGVKDLQISNQGQANVAMKVVDNALSKVSAQRSKLGAIQNRLEHTINNLGTASENLTASESRIRDVDMAKEMMNFTKTNVLNQAAQAMLSQANQLPNQVLQLLR